MNILVYILILVAKVIEVSVGTLRIVLITKGEKLLGSIIGFFEVILWLIIVSTVLKNVSSDPFKVFTYALGFAIGNYVGAKLEQILGIGNVRVEAIVKREHGKELAQSIREEGYAVTVMDGQGMNYERQVLIMNIRRKKIKEVICFIKRFQDNVVITINDIRPIYGGYNILKR